MKPFRFAVLCLFLLIAYTARAAENYDPAALAKTIEPYIDDSAMFVVHIDMTRADLAPVAAKVKELIPKIGSPDQQAAAVAGFDAGVSAANKWIADFTKAGGRDYFAVISMSGFPDFPVYAVVPLKQGADSQALIKLLTVDDPQNPGTTAEVRGDVIVWGRKTMLDSLKTLKPKRGGDLAKVFEAAGDSTGQILFAPSADTRKVLAELTPAPAAGPLEGSHDPITKGIVWAAIGVALSPDPSVNIVVQSPDAASAAALAQTLNKLVAFAKAMIAGEVARIPQAAAIVGDLDALAKAFTPTVAGDRLTFQLNASQSMALAGVMLPAVAQARSQATNTVSLNNVRQILMACEIYADKHNGEFPPDLKTLMKAQSNVGPILFKHPQMPDKEIGYQYLKPSKTVPVEQVVVYEDWDKAPPRIIVGFLDGHVETMDYARFKELLNLSKARLEEK